MRTVQMDDETRARRYRATGDHHRKMSRVFRELGRAEDAEAAERKAAECYARAEEIEADR